MIDLKTRYMGIEVASPVIVAACSLSGKIDNIAKAEEAGAGALVIKSLFEEQLMAESAKFQQELENEGEHFAESLSYFPPLSYGGPKEHVMWVKRTRDQVKMPLIASINAINDEAWVDFAKRLQDAGVDGLELNTYAVQTDVRRKAAEVEDQMLSTVEKVLKAVDIPVSVKLSPFYTSFVNVADRLSKSGVAALVLFNRFLQPDLDIETMSLRNSMELSQPSDGRVSLRYIALLHGKIKADLAAGGGIQFASGVVKQILAGASVVQVASALYTRGIDFVSTLNEGVANWMQDKGYNKLDDFRGVMSQQDLTDPFAYERSQYVELLMNQA